MAKSCTLALPLSLSQSQNLNHILGTQLNQKTRTISSWTRIFRSIFLNSISINRRNSSNVKYVLQSRRLTGVSAASLPSFSSCHISIRSSCDCFRFSSLSLLPLCRSRLSSLRFLIMMSHSAQHEQGFTVSQESNKTIRCVIKGRVQGVFYRNWTIENATQLGLKGWVRNRRDGSVEALFSGQGHAVDEMLQRCRHGPPDAMVTALEANPSQEEPGAGFERKPTI